MNVRTVLNPLTVAATLAAAPAWAQSTARPFPAPIDATHDIVSVGFREFAHLPDINGQPARPMLLSEEPGTHRLFVNDMRGPLYTVSATGTVAVYLDVSAPAWGVSLKSDGSELGVQSFAFHPQFNRPGTPGYGKFYTFVDTANTAPPPDYRPGGGTRPHDSVLLEWTTSHPAAPTYDGGSPRELFRLEHPFVNHNGGQIAFNPGASVGSPDFGLLYIASADGGSGGDPLDLAQNLASPFGKLLRIDPLGTNGPNGKYGIPASNPFVADHNPATLGEIYAYGLRNPQRFGWDPANGHLFVADIGQGIVEEIDLVTAGANFGWRKWEASFTYVSRTAVDVTNPRGDAAVTYPIVEYGHMDPLQPAGSAVTFGSVYRSRDIPQLTNVLVFGDFASGEIFYVNTDALPMGGQDAIRRILLRDGGTAKTLLQVIREKNIAQGQPLTTHTDLRFGQDAQGQIFLLNKHDGVIRLLVR